jgi:hypothetical protein
MAWGSEGVSRGDGQGVQKYSLLSMAFLNLYVAFRFFTHFGCIFRLLPVENVKQENIDEQRERLNPQKYFRSSYLREAVT